MRLAARSKQDDTEMKPALEPLPEQAALKLGQDTPIRTPTAELETSPLPESWDLYKQFKGRLSSKVGIVCVLLCSLWEINRLVVS